MGFDALIRGAYKTANRLTASLQVPVTHERWKAQDGYGAPTYAGAMERMAIVEPVQKMVRSLTGQELMARVRITFLEPIRDLNTGAVGGVTTGRRQPTDPRDRFTLPDGTTGPVLDIRSMTDPTTERPYAEEVWLG